jgi:hypothetical protein
MVVFCCACSAPTAGPVAPSSSPAIVTPANDTVTGGVVHADAANNEPFEWIYNPEDVYGHRGPDDDNCTFKFPLGGDPNFHPDAICWQRRAGHESEWPNLYRQQFQGVHFDNLPAMPPFGCNGGAGDLEGIRACRSDDNGAALGGATVPPVCTNTMGQNTTGGNGCTPCGQPIATCH